MCINKQREENIVQYQSQLTDVKDEKYNKGIFGDNLQNPYVKTNIKSLWAILIDKNVRMFARELDWTVY